MIKDLNESNFKESISSGYAFVDFWAEWCAPCKMMEPILIGASDELPTVKFFKVNIDDFPKLASSNNIMSIPNMIMFKDGEPVGSVIGATAKNALVQKIKTLLKVS